MKSIFIKCSRKGIRERLGKFECNFYSFELTQATEGLKREATMCPYGVLDANMSKVSKVYILVNWCVDAKEGFAIRIKKIKTL